MKPTLVKQDMNFMNYPLWFQERSPSERGFIWEDLEGYVYKTSYKVPEHTDLIILLGLISLSQANEWSLEANLTRYQLLNVCDLPTNQGTHWYKRLEDSLERWMHVVISFDQTFYDGHKKERIKGQFHILEHWKYYKDSKRLQVRFSPEWIEQIKHSNFYKKLDFNQVKAIRSPLATRLYEILVKSFQSDNKWSIGAKKLAAKIPMNEKYPAHIIPKIEAAVRRINESTSLKIELKVRRPKRGVAIFDFKDLEQKKKERKKSISLKEGSSPSPTKKEWQPKGGDELQKLLELLPQKFEGNVSLMKMLDDALDKHSFDYVEGNLLYTKKKAKDNFIGYLGKALKDDWGKEYLAYIKAERLKEQRRLEEAKREQQELERQKRMEQEFHQAWEQLT